MKRMTSLILALVVAAGMSASVFAAYDPVSQVEDLGYAYEGDEVTEQTVDLGMVYPSEELSREIPLVYGLFDSDPPDGKSWDDALAAEDMENIQVKVGAAEGSEAVTAELQRSEGIIRVFFAQDMQSDTDVPFDVTVYLIVDGERYDDMGLSFVGTAVADENAEPTDATDAPRPAGPNPDTGDVSFMGVAIAAMCVALVAIGVVALRRKK